MIRENKGDIRRFAFGLLAMIFMLTCIPSWAAFDIFDQPVQRERKKETAQREDGIRFLNYPQECFLKGNYEEALLASQKLIDYQPAWKLKGEISYLVGLSLVKLGRFLEARGYFNDILLLERGKEDLKREALLGIGDSYFLEGNFNKAYDTYAQILTKYPESEVNCVIYYKMAQALLQLDRGQEAKYYLDRIQEEFPFSFEARLLAQAETLPLTPTLSPEGRGRSCVGSPEGRGDIWEYYNVQTGCFNDKDNADKFCEKLVKEGFGAYILESEDNEEPRYRVKVGKFHSKDEAEAIESKLKLAGYSTKIYP